VIYLDNNATTRPSRAVVEAMRRGLEEFWHNPSSIHRPGQAAKQQMELARKHVAGLLGGQAREIVFTSSGTESLDLAVRGVLAGWPSERGTPKFITTKVEHSALRSLAEELRECEKAEVVYAPLLSDRSGRVDVGALDPLIDERTALVSVQWANNETGAIQPVKEIAAICRRRGAIFHTDATQWVGKLPTNVHEKGLEACCGTDRGPDAAPAPAHAGSNGTCCSPAPAGAKDLSWCDVLTCSPHKFYGPKGVGITWVRRGLRIKPCVRGSQELGRRGGTENTPGIMGAGAAAQEALAWLADPGNIARGRALRDRFENAMLEAAPGAVVNAPADTAHRVWNTSNIGFPRLEAEALLLMLSERGVCASAGAACSSGSLEASPVLTAMGVPHEIAFGSLRFSLAKDTTEAEVDDAVRIIAQTVEKLRRSTMAVV
jgi:cysteine desulfurase